MPMWIGGFGFRCGIGTPWCITFVSVWVTDFMVRAPTMDGRIICSPPGPAIFQCFPGLTYLRYSIPKRNTIIFGSPLTFDMKGSEPTDKELDKAHGLFIQELKALFDKQKSACGYHDREQR